MDRYILQIFYMSVKKVLSTYYAKEMHVSKPEMINIASFDTDIEMNRFDDPLIAHLDFKAEDRGRLIWLSCSEASRSLYTHLSGNNASMYSDQIMQANLEFINIPAGIIKRFFSEKDMQFTFSIPCLTKKAALLPLSLSEDYEKYIYRLTFDSLPAVIILLLNKKPPV